MNNKESETMKNEIELDGKACVLKGEVVTGRRVVLVADRGWVFAGDVERKDGRVRLTRAVHVLRWESIGFSGLVAMSDPGKIKTKPVMDVDMPASTELFCVPVNDKWGL